MLPVLHQQQAIAAANRMSYLKGMYTKRTQLEVKATTGCPSVSSHGRKGGHRKMNSKDEQTNY
jgi:hypothetical protein